MTAQIVNLEAVPWEEQRYPEEEAARGVCRDFGDAVGAVWIGANVHRLRPGEESARYHAHEFIEELFLVVGRRGRRGTAAGASRARVRCPARPPDPPHAPPGPCTPIPQPSIPPSPLRVADGRG